MVRIITFACVISVHVTSFTVSASDQYLYGYLALAHFTREVFFALSGFVLTYSYLNRPVPMRAFWPRRFLLVGVPYLVWSAIYTAIHWAPSESPWSLTVDYLRNLLLGTAEYHLYFLLVTMQLYLLFPLLVWLIRRTRGHHLVLVTISIGVQLALSALSMYLPGSVSWLNAYSNVLSYQGFIITGAVLADHPDRFFDTVRRRRKAITVAVIAAAAVVIAVFLANSTIFSAAEAAAAVQPAIMIWSFVIGLGLVAVGGCWAQRRRAHGLAARLVVWASDRSFGIFLAHPLVLWFLLFIGGGWFARTIPGPWLTVVMYVFVVIGAAVIADLARRSPLSLALAGRKRQSRALATNDSHGSATARTGP